MDPTKNFAIGVIQTPPSPPTTGVTIVLTSGQGGYFPDPSISGAYNVVVWAGPSVLPTNLTAEIVRVTARVSDTFTVTRTQESTSARQILQGDYIALVPTAKTFSDIQTLINSFPSTPVSVPNGGTGATTLTGIVKGNGTSAFTAVTAPVGNIIGDSDTQALTNKDLSSNSNTFPTSLVTLTGTQTLTNKTLTSPTLTAPLFQGTVDGWILANETWTYNTATTITVPSGAASKYGVGDKIKLTQTTVKYFYITSVSDTVLTINGGTDYTLVNAAITNNYYSHYLTPLGFPQWFNYSPTWGGFSSNPPTPIAKFTLIGTMCSMIINSLGSGQGTSNATNFTISVPITPVSSSDIYTIGQAKDNTSTVGIAYITFVSGTALGLNFNSLSGAWTASGQKGADFMFQYPII